MSLENVTIKKRGRKPKQNKEENIVIDNKDFVNKDINNKDIETNLNEKENNKLDNSNKEEISEDLPDNNLIYENKTPVIKKRGRKPKGGKIIQQINSIHDDNLNSKPSVILHLKCCLKDLEMNVMNTIVEPFYFSNNKHDLSFEIIETPPSINFQNSDKIIEDDEEICYNNNREYETKEIWNKLKHLEHNLHNNNINNKKSACFWCTYDFDNPPIYIPKHFIKNSYHVYGCFCSPECAVAYLMEENIDSSSKFERYYLINHIYSKIYDYKQNIKPSPNPYYMLDKYYGNLTIQEYRSLLRNERLFLIIEKPLTRIMPELHEDNDDFIINNKIIPSNNYQLRKKIQKKHQTKNNIINEKFGIV